MIEYPIRRWQPSDDLDRLVVVSQAADVMFATFGLSSLPPDDPTDELLRAEHVLVAGSPPVGFAVVNTVDGRAHLAGLGVHPEFGRRERLKAGDRSSAGSSPGRRQLVPQLRFQTRRPAAIRKIEARRKMTPDRKSVV